MMRPESHSPEPRSERPSEKPDVYEISLRVQRQIMERLADEAARIDWISAHAANFRKLVDSDERFRAALSDESIDEIIKRLENEENRLQ